MYANQADMEKRFQSSELVSLTAKNGGTVLDAGVLVEALVSATARIDAYLASSYSVPLADVPIILRDACCDIARYDLDPRPPEDVRRRYEATISFLKDLQSGRATLALPSGEQVKPKAGIQYTSGGRTFSSDTLNDYNGGR